MPSDSEQTNYEPTALAEMAQYQDAAVVSRTIVNKRGGSVTAFAFADGQGLSEHTAPFDALVYILDGEAEVAIAGEPLRLTAGDMVIMPSNQPHALRALTRFKMLLVMIAS